MRYLRPPRGYGPQFLEVLAMVMTIAGVLFLIIKG
jgi:hypothetical protein